MKIEEIKSDNGITLIALIITIIVMLILAGIVLSLTISENGIMKKAEESGKAYSEQEAREKLELVLLDMQADKIVNSKYNQEEYLTKKIEENGMQVVEYNIVSVDGWKFEINRDVPEIAKGIEQDEIITIKENALVLDGDTYIETNIQESDFIKTDGSFTVAARVKINKVGQKAVNTMDILGNHSNNEGYVWQFNEKTSILRIGTTDLNKVEIDYTPYYDQWVDIITTYQNKNNKVYINGKLIAEKDFVVLPYEKFLIGTGYTFSDRRMKGMIASVKVWNEQLTSEEIGKISLLADKTKIKSGNIKLETILDSMEDVNKIGNIKGNSRFERRDFKLEYAIKFLGGTYINTKWQQSELFTDNNQFTISARVKINRNEQSSVSYMDILGNHVNYQGYVWQFDGTGTTLNVGNKLIVSFDYTPYYDQWVDISCVHNNGTQKIYINHQLVVSKNDIVIPAYNNFLIGTGYLSSNRAMKGSVASVKMWKVALTQEEVVKIDMLTKENIQQENILNEVILENDDNVNEIGNFVGASYTYILRH